MIPRKIRTAALALAAVGLVATSLTTGAAAAPGPGADDSARFTLPVTDIQVTRISAAGSGAPGERASATFEVKNAGQQSMAFNFYTDWSSRRIADDTWFPHQVSQDLTLSPGQSKQVTLTCQVPNTQYECTYFIAMARWPKGIDTNMNNNAATFEP